MDSLSLNTKLIEASEQGELASVEKLLGEGASVDYKDAAGRTALMAATQNNQIEIAKRLIEAGSDVNTRDITQLTVYLLSSKWLL